MGIHEAADEIRKPKGKRKFPPDISHTPFAAVANEIAARAVREFADKSPVPMTLKAWGDLEECIRWRFAHALYDMAYPPPNRADGSFVRERKQ